MVQVASGTGCPMIAVREVTIPGGRGAVRVAAQMMARLRFGASVHPLVPGATGSARQGRCRRRADPYAACASAVTARTTARTTRGLVVTTPSSRL